MSFPNDRFSTGERIAPRPGSPFSVLLRKLPTQAKAMADRLRIQGASDLLWFLPSAFRLLPSAFCL